MAQTEFSTGTLAAYFEDSNDAQKAVDALQRAGFTSAHLGVAHRGSYTGVSSTYGNTTVRETEDDNGPSTWDKIKAWFSGNESETRSKDRGAGAVDNREIAPPPSERIDEGYDEGYDDTSDLHGSFTAMNIPEDRARYFAHRFGRGTNSAVVTVEAGNRRAEAEAILRQYEADFGENAGNYDYEGQSNDYRDSEVSQQKDRFGGERKFQLLGEILRVHKDRVKRGEVRLRKEVLTENQTLQVPVQREELVIERRPIGNNTPSSKDIREDEMRVPLTEERATLDKSTVVREEVSVGKKPVEQVRDLTGDVRHEELVVDDETKRERSA